MKKLRESRSTSKKPLLLGDSSVAPRLAFHPFALEDEWYGRRRMRIIANGIEWAQKAPNASIETLFCFHDACDHERAKWHHYYDQNEEIFHTAKHVSITPEEAVRNLLAISKSATAFLAMVLEKKPELCKTIASIEPQWPVLIDMTEKDWKRAIEVTVSTLELGRDIKGYLLAARTADENVIRCWATAIYSTLFQTRFNFKEALKKPDAPLRTEGCPEWAKKTLDLPPFTKANARKWAKLGEEMLLEQRADFLESPDLVGKKRSWTHRAQQDSRSGKASLRAIHREAFEDFAKELKNIAPERNISRGKW